MLPPLVMARPSVATIHVVLTRSGNRCAMPDCRKVLVVPETDRDSAKLTAKVAHIAGNNPGSARYNPEMIDEERNSTANLIAVCATCHDKIDGQPSTYTTPVLCRIKIDHESWVVGELGRNMSSVGFPELEQVALHVMASEGDPGDLDAPLPPGEKIAKNSLSQRSEEVIRHGMMASKRVEAYLNTSTAGQLAGRLRSGLAREYKRHKNDGLVGDELFDAMCRFVAGTGNFARDAAGVAVLAHFFESCEVFEK